MRAARGRNHGTEILSRSVSIVLHRSAAGEPDHRREAQPAVTAVR